MHRPVVASFAVAALLGACTTTQPILPERVSIDRPALGETNIAVLGDVVLERSQSRRYEGLLLENQVTWFDLLRLRQFTIRPGRLVAREIDREFTYYYSDQTTFRDLLSGLASASSGGICIRKTDPSYVRAFATKGLCGIVPDQRPVITRLRVPEIGAENYRRELIYRGRSGSVLGFVYRELSDDQPYPTLSLDFHVDLEDGIVFVVRGARIEVVDATNSKLTYRVISSFPEIQR